MRELKFRVWDGMKLEYNIVVGALGTFYAPELDKNDSSCITSFNTIYSKDVPVMQYTGIKDKNGVEIYEGDNIRVISDDSPTYRNNLDIWEVVFQDGEFCAQNIDDCVGLHYWASCQIEII